MNRQCSLLGREGANADDRDSAERRNPRAVELQEGQTAENHAEVNEQKYDDDSSGHGKRWARLILAFGCPRIGYHRRMNQEDRGRSVAYG
jgi:hypothetical protein